MLQELLDSSKESVVIIMGYPGIGKTSYCKQFEEVGFQRFNRDMVGGKLEDLIPRMENAFEEGSRKFVLDNTYIDKKSRAPVVQWAKKHQLPIHLVLITTKKKKDAPNDIEVAQYNVVKRMIDSYGRLLTNEEIKESKDPSVYPAVVLFAYRKNLEVPSLDEGFTSIIPVIFKRKMDSKIYKNKALILDYDGTLRKTKSGKKYPRSIDDIEILPKRKEVLQQYLDKGYLLLGVSNQSGVGKGEITKELAEACFEQTNKLLGFDIDYRFCPHASFPLNCYCRKPMPGLGVVLTEEYKLDPSETIMIGDLTSDKTFAKRSGFQFVKANEFFGI